MLRKLGIALGVAVFLIWGIGGAVDTIETLPDHAIVAVYGGVYYPGRFEIVSERLPDVSLTEVHFMTAARAKWEGYAADEVCKARDDFIGEQGTLLGTWLQRLGWLRASRWNPDGTWRW